MENLSWFSTLCPCARSLGEGKSYVKADLGSEADRAKLVRKNRLLQKMKYLDLYTPVCGV